MTEEQSAQASQPMFTVPGPGAGAIVPLQGGGRAASSAVTTVVAGPQLEEGELPSAVEPASAMVRAISDAVNYRCAGSTGEFFDPDEKGVYEVNMDFYTMEAGSLDDSNTTERTQTLEIADLAGAGIDVGKGGQVLVTDVIPFVILKFNPETDKTWTVPDPSTYQDLINSASGRIVERNLPCGAAYRWANLWGKVGLLGLSPKNMDHVREFRALIEEHMAGRTRFTLFPKDALDKRDNLSVLLRDNFLTFKAEWLPQWIITRSRIRGGLRVTHVKEYAESDRTRSGTSKRGWRLVLLQGCPLFMKSLERFDQEHRFPVAAGHVIIRGGAGRPKSRSRGNDNNNNESRQGPSGSGRRRSGQSKRDDEQRRAQQGQYRRSREDNRNYEHDYPALTNEADEATTGGGSGQSRRMTWGDAPWSGATRR